MMEKRKKNVERLCVSHEGAIAFSCDREILRCVTKKEKLRYTIMMKPWMWGVLLAVIAFLGWGVYTLASERNALESDWEGFQATVAALQSENASLRKKIEYFKLPENLIKELKSQFNYTEAGEKLLIIIPPASTSTATSTR